MQIDVGGLNESARDRNRLCIEVSGQESNSLARGQRSDTCAGQSLQDPFETPYNVARTVTKDGLYTIRGEFMRATRVSRASETVTERRSSSTRLADPDRQA